MAAARSSPVDPCRQLPGGVVGKVDGDLRSRMPLPEKTTGVQARARRGFGSVAGRRAGGDAGGLAGWRSPSGGPGRGRPVWSAGRGRPGRRLRRCAGGRAESATGPTLLTVDDGALWQGRVSSTVSSAKQSLCPQLVRPSNRGAWRPLAGPVSSTVSTAKQSAERRRPDQPGPAPPAQPPRLRPSGHPQQGRRRRHPLPGGRGGIDGRHRRRRVQVGVQGGRGPRPSPRHPARPPASGPGGPPPRASAGRANPSPSGSDG